VLPMVALTACSMTGVVERVVGEWDMTRHAGERKVRGFRIRCKGGARDPRHEDQMTHILRVLSGVFVWI